MDFKLYLKSKPAPEGLLAQSSLYVSKVTNTLCKNLNVKSQDIRK